MIPSLSAFRFFDLTALALSLLRDRVVAIFAAPPRPVPPNGGTVLFSSASSLAAVVNDRGSAVSDTDDDDDDHDGDGDGGHCMNGGDGGDDTGDVGETGGYCIMGFIWFII